MGDPVSAWLDRLEARHLADLRFADVVRALRALSSAYVERRSRLSGGAALQGAGKRAAFALYYGPLHFCAVRAIVRSLAADAHDVRPIVDLGCGSGVAGAAWALAFARPPRVIGVERHPWAIAEAAWTYRALGIHALTVRNDLERHRLPGAGAGLIAAYTLNELATAAREFVRDRLIDAAGRGARVLIVEPVAGWAMPDWADWESAVVGEGGRSDQWRLALDLPDIVRRLARAAGLKPDPLAVRSLWLDQPSR